MYHKLLIFCEYIFQTVLNVNWSLSIRIVKFELFILFTANGLKIKIQNLIIQQY